MPFYHRLMGTAEPERVAPPVPSEPPGERV
jgi:hypothetical protein